MADAPPRADPRPHQAGSANRFRRLVSIPLTVWLERRRWDRRADSWDQEGSAGLVKVVDAVLQACEPAAGLTAIDLGCGSGQVTIPLAARAAHVTGVDVSALSIKRLREKCAAAGITNISAQVAPAQTLELAPGSLDLIVSNYALHHIDDADKADLLRAAAQWLRPGGRLVVGDIMIGRGASAEDRQIIAEKLKVLARRGPAGWWRIAKNAWRFGLRTGERPLPRWRWEGLARDAGFVEVRTEPVRGEAALLLATRPLAEPIVTPDVAHAPVPRLRAVVRASVPPR